MSNNNTSIVCDRSTSGNLRQRGLTEDQLVKFIKLENRQENFHQWLKAKNLNRNEEQAIRLQNLEESANFWSEKSREGQKGFVLKHHKGWSRWVKKYQGFAEGALAFMEDIRPVLDIARDFGAPYSGLAVGTISCLFVVAARKNDMEDRVASALDGIQDRLPGLKMYMRIYTGGQALETNLRRKILNAYISLVDLSIDIMEYYYKPGYRRWAIATFQSAQFFSKIQVTFELFASITTICGDLLNQNVNNIKEQNSEMKRMLNEMERERDEIRLREFQELLRVERCPQRFQASLCKKTLKEVFPNCQAYSTSWPWSLFCQMNPHLLETCTEFREWKRAQESCLLFLSGRTAWEGRKLRGFSHCWLSPAAIYIAEEMRNKKEHVTFFSCQPDDITQDIEVTSVISSIISQILGERPDVLRKKNDEFRSIIDNHSHSDDEFTKPNLEMLIKLLNAVVLNLENSGTTVIIIDRLDRCVNKEIEIGEIMNELARLVSGNGNTSVKLKVAVVVEKSIEDRDWRPDFLFKDHAHSNRLFIRRSWNQEQLINNDLNRVDPPLTWDDNDELSKVF